MLEKPISSSQRKSIVNDLLVDEMDRRGFQGEEVLLQSKLMLLGSTLVVLRLDDTIGRRGRRLRMLMYVDGCHVDGDSGYVCGVKEVVVVYQKTKRMRAYIGLGSDHGESNCAMIMYR